MGSKCYGRTDNQGKKHKETDCFIINICVFAKLKLKNFKARIERFDPRWCVLLRILVFVQGTSFFFSSVLCVIVFFFFNLHLNAQHGQIINTDLQSDNESRTLEWSLLSSPYDECKRMRITDKKVPGGRRVEIANHNGICAIYL